MGRMRRTAALGGVALLAATLALDPALADRVVATPVTPNIEAGFHMEGAAEIELVFGDIKAFEARIDRFYELERNMSASRRSFTRHVHAAIDSLATKRWGCPTDALALPYYDAHSASAAHRAIGKQLEVEYFAIRKLDRLGETFGLTPGYRSRVNKSRAAYRAALVDFQEMRVAFGGQLGYAARRRGCNTKTLLKKGAAGVVAAPADKVAAPKKKATDVPPELPIMAKPVTFFVDNTSCPTSLGVYVDGMSMGEVTPRAKAAFQTLAGRRALCLIPSTSNAQCGEVGTLRSAYIHDGWSISTHCQTPTTVSVLD
jgi:hypothetical protein